MITTDQVIYTIDPIEVNEDPHDYNEWNFSTAKAWVGLSELNQDKSLFIRVTDGQQVSIAIADLLEILNNPEHFED